MDEKKRLFSLEDLCRKNGARAIENVKLTLSGIDVYHFPQSNSSKSAFSPEVAISTAGFQLSITQVFCVDEKGYFA